MTDLEIWLIGTPAELDAAARALAAIGWVLKASSRTPLAGADAGRWRTYARIRVRVAYPPTGPAARAADRAATQPRLAA